MIYTQSLLEAREQAAILTRDGHTAYIYRLESGTYWLTLTPKDDLTLVEKSGHRAA